MEGDLKKGLEACPQLLDLIANEREWLVKEGGGEANGFGVAEERKLELRLAPPGEEDWVEEKEKRVEHSVKSILPLGHLSKVAKNNGFNPCSGAKRGFLGAVEPNSEGFERQQSGLLHLQSKAGMEKEQQSTERKASGPPHAVTAGNVVVSINSSQARTATTPIVGWPPIRSFRKNIASSSKPGLGTQNVSSETAAKFEDDKKGLFVKINMDGIPIGRKVDLKAYNNYEKLSLAVDELFSALLSAQRDPVANGGQKNAKEKETISTGLLDGSGEYTLVYEDEEGDKMLVGDVPWDMFISTAKRLRVLKSSNLSASSLRSVSRKRTATEC
ncbi:auxin-responsive protein IAA16-like [Typha latifolia]|uniref:auxin-responsive protein IAA16-like n=1 Tax=Typha latifolia TaxID=4733 RepID=UPI003C2ED719